MFRACPAAALAGALSLMATVALAQQAQSAPPKPKAQAPSIVMPAAPARKSSTKTLGGQGLPAGKVMRREELRACLKRTDDMAATNKELLQRRTALDGERDELTRSGDQLKTAKADVDAKQLLVQDWQGRARALAADVEAFNRKVDGAEQAPRGRREELAKALDAERDSLNKRREALAAEEPRLVPPYEAGVRAYNERVLARDSVVNDWNARNKALNDAASKLEGDRTDWFNDCANRPYLEDDEIAIKAGK
jgi:hypothetical protein